MSNPSTFEKSFKWCVCILLLFIAIGVVVLLVLTRSSAQKNGTALPHEGKTTNRTTTTMETPKGPVKDGEKPKGPASDGETPKGPVKDGEKPKGPAPDGETPKGPVKDGEKPKGPAPDGETPKGPAPDGETPKGPVKDGEKPKGSASDGETPKVPVKDGEKPKGSASDGKTPKGPVKDGETPKGPVKDGEKPKGSASDGKTPKGPVKDGETPKVPVKDGEKPKGPAPDGETPKGPVKDGEKPKGPAPDGETPKGPAPDGETPKGPVKDGEKPKGSASDGETPKVPVKDGEKPKGSASDGKTPKGPVKDGETPKGPVKDGEKPKGSALDGKTPKGPVKDGETPKVPVKDGEKPKGPAPDGETPKGPVKDGEKPKGPASDGETPKGPVKDGEKPKGSASDGETPKVPVKDGEKPKGSASDGKTPKGPVKDGEKPKGSASDGKTPKGPVKDGEKPKGSASDGKTPKGPVKDGEKPKGSASDGKTPKGPVKDGEKPKGSASDGETPKVPVKDGEKPKGSASDGETPKVPLSPPSKRVCYSLECNSTASHMFRLMDLSANSCNDFYQFSCGGMTSDSFDSFTWTSISEKLYPINNSTDNYLQPLKTFYDSCVSSEYNFNYQTRIGSVRKLVQEVGEIADEHTPNSTIDITQLFKNLILLQSHPFMDVDVEIDSETSKFILKLTPPRPTSILKKSGHWSALTETQKRCRYEQQHKLEQNNLNLNEIYESYLTCQNNQIIYLDSIENGIKTLGFSSDLNNEGKQTRITNEWNVLDILNILPSPSLTKQEALFTNYEILDISKLELRYPMVEWKKLFTAITGSSNLEDNTKVHVYFSSYFNETFEKLNSTLKWKINNALIALYANKLYENLVIPQTKDTKENYCLTLSSKLFHDISSNLYMRALTQNQITEFTQLVQGLFDRLKQNLTSALQEQKWLDADSKASATSKLNKLKLIIPQLEDMDSIDINHPNKHYVSADMTTDFQNNFVKMLKINSKMRFGLVGEAISPRYLWNYIINVYDKRPTSLFAQGEIMVPLGMAKNSMKGLPGYITMAQIGQALAKEISRHIQNKMILSKKTQSTYKRLETVAKDELSLIKTKDHTATFKVASKLSLNERIADNTAFRLISDSFVNFGAQTLPPWVSELFSREQLFYITAAQEFCQKTDMFEFMQQLFESATLPAPLRVENMVRNSKQFATAFKCSLSNSSRGMQFPYLLENDV